MTRLVVGVGALAIFILASLCIPLRACTPPVIEIPLVVHLLDQDGVTHTGIERVVGVANRKLQPYFHLQLLATDCILDADRKWRGLFDGLDDRAGGLKSSFREGGPETLNVYVVQFAFIPALGFSSFPWELRTRGLAQDAVLLSPRVFAEADYRDTLAHEVGHWLGLEHTLDTRRCTLRDIMSPTMEGSCAEQDRFTEWQFQQMTKMWKAWRAPHPPATGGSCCSAPFSRSLLRSTPR